MRRQLVHEFHTAGIETPDLDARILIGHALGLDHPALATQADRALSVAEMEAIGALARRRLAHEPVARILGVREFWGLSLALNADTLVPRPETETVVEAALACVGKRRTEPLRIADLATGSGAILLALLSELPAARGTGTDISEGALTCARGNAEALGLSARATFVACDYGTALEGPFDLVVSNPPYIARSEIASLEPDVRLFDPHLALDGGPDGLDGYRAIAAGARRLLAPGAVLVVELGSGQSRAVSTMFTAAGLAIVTMRNDLSGIARALVARALP
jgi:release factor glutamine methyltransferase